jgi:hypothetical protein
MTTYFIILSCSFKLAGQFSGTLQLRTLSPWAELVKANQALRCSETLPGSLDHGGSLIVVMPCGGIPHYTEVLFLLRHHHEQFNERWHRLGQ